MEYKPENLDKPPIEVRHADLKKWDEDSAYKVICPTCDTGLLLVQRNQKTFAILRQDLCIFCGQRVHYIDESINKEPLNDL
jgi:hypothetical protein